MRTPSWCDRILWKKSDRVTLLNYGRDESMLSDHRPVFAMLDVKVDQENAAKKRLVEQ